MEGVRELTVEDLLDRLAEEYEAGKVRADEFTVMDFARRLSVTHRVAQGILDNYERQGKVLRREVHDGNIKWAYRLAD